MRVKVIGKQKNSTQCVGCRPDSPLGTMRYYNLENGYALGMFNLSKNYVSYPGTIHGGITATFLDELLCRCHVVGGENMWGVTKEMTIRYRRPVPPEIDLFGVSKITSMDEKSFTSRAWLLSEEGEILAEGRSSYVKFNDHRMKKFGMDKKHMILLNDDEDPKYIDIPDEILNAKD